MAGWGYVDNSIFLAPRAREDLLISPLVESVMMSDHGTRVFTYQINMISSNSHKYLIQLPCMTIITSDIRYTL